MKAIISIYKSDAVEYLKENDIKREDVVIMCSNAEVMSDENKEKFDEIVVISAPMGVPNNADYLKNLLVKKAPPAAPPKPKAIPKAAPKAKAKTNGKG